MGQAGRLKTPTQTLVERGNPHAAARQHKEARTITGRPECPEYLSDYAKEYFEAICDDLHERGMLSPSWLPVLVVYAETMADFREACEMLQSQDKFIETMNEKSGRVSVDFTGAKKLRDDAGEKLIKLAGHFGFSPSTVAGLLRVDATRRHNQQEANEASAASRKKSQQKAKESVLSMSTAVAGRVG